jgi:DNA-binding transcriptional LysR family regulator
MSFVIWQIFAYETYYMRNSDMELKQLEYFLAVSNTHSFTRAAEQLYISQPSVTTAIQRLEDELGLVLFDRSKKQATLTSEGEIFYEHICIVMRDISKAAQKAAELKNLSSGVIKIGVSSLTCLSVSSFLLAKFHNIYPSLKFEFIETTTQNIQNLIEKDKIDLGLLIVHESMKNLDFVTISNEALSVYLPLFHFLSERTNIALKELKQEIFILPQKNCTYRLILDAMFAREEIKPHISFETNYIQMIKNMIISGSGISILPKGVIENSAIRAIPLEKEPSIHLCIAKKNNKCIAHAAQTLYDFLKDSFSM